MLEIVSSQTGTIVLNRRKLLRIVTGGALAALGAAAFGSTRSARADYTGFYRTTTDLNLRSKPSKQGKILLVIPDNAMVSHAGGYQAPWIQVTYNGTTGWASGDYLVDTNGGSTDGGGPMTNVATTTTSVNMRSGPDKGNSVLKVLGKGTSVQVSDQYQNGYRYVSHQGTTGWIYADYLASGNGPEPGFATVTVDLNLRAEPSTNAKVIVVMPAGSQVSAGDQFSNGFRMVTYGNRTGWAYEAYLA